MSWIVYPWPAQVDAVVYPVQVTPQGWVEFSTHADVVIYPVQVTPQGWVEFSTHADVELTGISDGNGEPPGPGPEPEPSDNSWLWPVFIGGGASLAAVALIYANDKGAFQGVKTTAKRGIEGIKRKVS